MNFLFQLWEGRGAFYLVNHGHYALPLWSTKSMPVAFQMLGKELARLPSAPGQTAFCMEGSMCNSYFLIKQKGIFIVTHTVKKMELEGWGLLYCNFFVRYIWSCIVVPVTKVKDHHESCQLCQKKKKKAKIDHQTSLLFPGHLTKWHYPINKKIFFFI